MRHWPEWDDRVDGGWPRYIPLVCATIVVGIAAAAMFQERGDGYTLSAGFVAACVIAAPFLVDVFGASRGIDPPAWWLYLFPLPVAAGVGYFMFHPAEADIAPFALVFTVGELVARSRGLIGTAIWSGVVAVGTVITAELAGPWDMGAPIWAAGIVFGWIGGYLIRELDTRTVQLELAQADLAHKAATEERSRIAREVHDVIAHSLSVTMLHITAARLALETGGRSEEAADSLREAERQGRRSLSEIRRTVGLLGAEDGATAPMPGTSDLPGLVDGFRDAGLEATLSIRGDVAGLPPATGLNIYRIVQESLTNVAKHAPGSRATVDLDVGPSEIRLLVHNDTENGALPRANGDGLGLRGMAERAETLGGRLETDHSDGWTVLVTAPRRPA